MSIVGLHGLQLGLLTSTLGCRTRGEVAIKGHTRGIGGGALHPRTMIAWALGHCAGGEVLRCRHPGMRQDHHSDHWGVVIGTAMCRTRGWLELGGEVIMIGQ
jgi:hypothetical protein